MAQSSNMTMLVCECGEYVFSAKESKSAMCEYCVQTKIMKPEALRGVKSLLSERTNKWGGQK